MPETMRLKVIAPLDGRDPRRDGDVHDGQAAVMRKKRKHHLVEIVQPAAVGCLVCPIWEPYFCEELMFEVRRRHIRPAEVQGKRAGRPPTPSNQRRLACPCWDAHDREGYYGWTRTAAIL